MSTKTIDQYFADWESSVFGYGYGTGEPHTIAALQTFMRVVPCDSNYNYEDLERSLTPTVAWLLINALAKVRIIEYGTSPRFGWLTPQGKALREHVLLNRTTEQLVHSTLSDARCYPDHCNCDNGKCNNPFWITRK